VGFWLEPEALATGNVVPKPVPSVGVGSSAQETINDLLDGWTDIDAASALDEFTDMLQPIPKKTKPTDMDAASALDEFTGMLQPILKKTTLVVPNIPRKSPVTKVQYRREVAIPRFMEKRKRRNWERDLMHPSRSEAALRRPRMGGQFRLASFRFLPSSELHSASAN